VWKDFRLVLLISEPHIVGRAALQVNVKTVEVEAVVVRLTGRCDASNQSVDILCSHSRAVFCCL